MAPWLIGQLRQRAIADGLICDLGCGSGVLAGAMSNAGYRLVGVDVSFDMIAIARREAPSAAFLVASLHDVRLPTCEGVTCIGEAVSYLAPGEHELRLEPLFAHVARALRPGGLFIFDVIDHAGGERMFYTAERAGEGWRVTASVSENVEKRIVTRHIATEWTVDGVARREDELHRVQTFDAASLQAALEELGFAVQQDRSYGAVPLPPRRIGFVCEKRLG